MNIKLPLFLFLALLAAPAVQAAEEKAPAPAAVEKQAVPEIKAAPAAAAPTPEPAAPQHSRILPVKIKPVQEGADGVSKAAPDIEQKNSVDPDTLALYATQAAGSFGPEVWKGIPRKTLIDSFAKLPVPEFSPTERQLSLRTLLTQAAIPADTTEKPQPEIFSARLSKLIELGAFKEAMSLYEKLDAQASSSASALAGMKAFVANNQVAIACLEQRALDKELKSDDVFWTHLDKFCAKYIRTDDDGIHDVSQSLMRASVAYAAEEKILPPARFEDLNEKSIVELLVLAKSGALDRGRWTVETAAKLNPRVIGFLLSIDAASPDQKLALMTVAVRQGLKTPLDLDAAYEQASTAKDWSPFLSARKKLKSAQTTAAKTEAVKALLARIPQVSPVALTPFKDVIASLEPAAPITAAEARQVLDVLIAADASLPLAWVKLAYGTEVKPESEESGESALISVWLPATAEQKKPADKSPAQVKPAGPPKTQKEAYLLVLKAFMDGTEPIPAAHKGAYEKLLSLTGENNYVMPSGELMENLKKAAQTKHLGQVILAGLQALNGQKPENIHPSVMVQVLKSFESVGLSEETASLAHEVLAGLTTEKKEN